MLRITKYPQGNGVFRQVCKVRLLAIREACILLNALGIKEAEAKPTTNKPLFLLYLSLFPLRKRWQWCWTFVFWQGWKTPPSVGYIEQPMKLHIELLLWLSKATFL